MPVSPVDCNPQRFAPLMHIHGTDDYIISYNQTWDWKAWAEGPQETDSPTTSSIGATNMGAKMRVSRGLHHRPTSSTINVNKTLGSNTTHRGAGARMAREHQWRFDPSGHLELFERDHLREARFLRSSMRGLNRPVSSTSSVQLLKNEQERQRILQMRLHIARFDTRRSLLCRFRRSGGAKTG